MASSSSTWARVRNPKREYWRRREAGWRALGILSLYHSRPNGPPLLHSFSRYDYLRLWREQGGTDFVPALCGLCSKALVVHRWEEVSNLGRVGTGQGIDVDHAHSHGMARALLHGRCNRMVGLMDSKHALLVLNYLLKHESRLTQVGEAP